MLLGSYGVWFLWLYSSHPETWIRVAIKYKTKFYFNTMSVAKYRRIQSPDLHSLVLLTDLGWGLVPASSPMQLSPRSECELPRLLHLQSARLSSADMGPSWGNSHGPSCFHGDCRSATICWCGLPWGDCSAPLWCPWFTCLQSNGFDCPQTMACTKKSVRCQ